MDKGGAKVKRDWITKTWKFGPIEIRQVNLPVVGLGWIGENGSKVCSVKPVDGAKCSSQQAIAIIREKLS